MIVNNTLFIYPMPMNCLSDSVKKRIAIVRIPYYKKREVRPRNKKTDEEGLEPPVGESYNGFQDRRLRPLGHSSVYKCFNYIITFF